MKRYKYSLNGGSHWEGPFTEFEIQELRACGIIDHTALIMEEPELMQPMPVSPNMYPQHQVPQIPQTAAPYCPAAAPGGPVVTIYNNASSAPPPPFGASSCVTPPPPTAVGWSLGCAFSSCMHRYAMFTGRTSRSEYWLFSLAQVLIYIPFLIYLMLALESNSEEIVASALVLYSIVILGFILPSMAAAVRRLHDANFSGFLILLNLIPYIGSLILLVLLVIPGTAGPNQYGAASLPPVR